MIDWKEKTKEERREKRSKKKKKELEGMLRRIEGTQTVEDKMEKMRK